MKFWVPLGLEQAGKAAWQYKKQASLLCCVLGMVGVYAYTTWGSTPEVLPQDQPPRRAALPPLHTKKADLAKDWLTLQDKYVLLERQFKETQDTNKALRASLEEDKRTRQRDNEQFQQQLAKQFQAAVEAHATRAAQQAQDRQRQTIKPVPAAKTPPPVQTPVTIPTRPRGTIQLHTNDSKGWEGGATPLPDAERAHTAYLPAGSFAEVRLVTGAYATARRGGALPTLLSTVQSFRGPHQLHGPGRRPETTAIPIAGCLILAKAEADLSSSRANMTLDLLSCVFPDAASYQKTIKGYVVGPDGKLGMPCELETRDSAYLARTFLVSLMSGAAEAMALAKRTVVVTPFGGTQSTVTGNVGELAGFSAISRATADMSKFYLEQAERLMPVLRCDAGLPGKVVLQEGVVLDGFPTQVILSQQEGGHE